MGSAGEDPFRPIDGSVGNLVWVRRRNGSWWPGRILSPDELPEGCLPTPRSGTPVKLLGREDASIDWYNLEKSKRVKPFRCGEYDDCIEKAKASASHLSKKVVKYARREDAILHALELENARLGISDMSTGQDTRDDDEQHLNEGSPRREQSEEENINEGLSRSEDGSDSAPEPSLGSMVSFEEMKRVKRRRTPNDSEDGGSKGMKKRMRGLEDLGMGGASSLRRKRTLNSHVHEFMKKKNRRRTLSKVLESTPMVYVAAASGFESNESNKNNNNSDSTTGSVSLNLSRNGDEDGVGAKAKENEISTVVSVGDDRSCELFDVPLVAEEKQQSAAGVSNTVSVLSRKTQVSGAYSSQSSHVETISLGNNEHNEIGSTGSGPAGVHNNVTQIIEKNTSKWQLKGKRNSRPRKIDTDDESETHSVSNRVHGYLISDVDKKETQVEEFRGWSWNVPSPRENNAGGSKSDVVAPQRKLPYRQSRFTVNPKYESSDYSLTHHMSNGEPALYDVNMEVQMSHQPQHVPCISVMSKLNGKPVMGHPLSIKVLDDGFCDDLLSYSSSSKLEYNSLNSLSERKPRRRLASKHRSTSKSRKNGSKNGLLSKKIRKLSSLTSTHRKRQNEKNPVLEKMKGPSIACVPIKLVFSRINAALSSSIRPSPRLTTTSGT